MRLSNRLQAIADEISTGNRLADIGTDHGYLPIAMVQENKVPHAIAMDVNKGPLERAASHIAQYGLEAYIETRRSDGLSELKKDQADTVVIAGMGGFLTVKILKAGGHVLPYIKELILQPQSEIHLVREFLWQQGYPIVKENMIYEDGKYYTVMKALVFEPLEHGTRDQISDQMNVQPNDQIRHRVEAETNMPSREHLYYGKYLLEHKNPVLEDFLKDRSKLCMTIQKQLLENGKDDNDVRVKEIKEEMQMITSALAYYEM